MTNKNLFGKWYEILEPVVESDFFKQTILSIEAEYMKSNTRVLPDYHNVFRAFKETNPEDFKVLIIGQDPYPSHKHATGIAFGIPFTSTSIPPSLMNLRNEIELSMGSLAVDFDVTLESWCRQGVLLLNSSLTVIEGKPGSHAHL
jgi:uracil-DNA glycosylase